MAIEPRGVCVMPEPYGGDFTIYSATQIPHILKVMLGITLGLPEHKLRVVAPSVGGGFGSKLNVYAEEALCLALANRLKRPVRWNEERTENAQATTHGRAMIQDIELAADGDGKVTAVRVNLLADMGAYLQLVTPGIPLLGAFLYHGVYDVPAYHFECTGVFTNRPPLDRALELVGYDDVRAEQQRRRDAGDTKHLGVGVATYVEMCGLAPSRVLASLNYAAGGSEAATVPVLPTGKVQVVSGATPHGQ